MNGQNIFTPTSTSKKWFLLLLFVPLLTFIPSSLIAPYLLGATSPSVPPCSCHSAPLLAVCYSCWSNLEYVPNPLSILPSQHNAKWIRRDYCLRLPHPPLLHTVTLSSSLTFMSIFLMMFLVFINRIEVSALSRWQIGCGACQRQMLTKNPMHHGTLYH